MSATDRTDLAGIGNTPLVELERFSERSDIRAFAKLESHNPGGSSKARSAERMIADAVAAGLASSGTTVIESTSGNLGLGLALVCRARGMGLICVVDSRTDEAKIRQMESLGAEVRVVTEPDPRTGDLLAARLELVDRLVRDTPNSYRPDQYANESSVAAHFGTMAEIDEALDGEIDWLFVATSTTGTLRGCCDYLVENERETRVVAVDAVGSVLFGGERGRRLLPGFGAGVETELSRRAWFDTLVRVTELDCVVGCRRLLASDEVFAGASSGGVAMALESIAPLMEPGARCAMIFADGGEGYAATVYDDDWVRLNLLVEPWELARLSGTGRASAQAA